MIVTFVGSELLQKWLKSNIQCKNCQFKYSIANNGEHKYSRYNRVQYTNSEHGRSQKAVHSSAIVIHGQSKLDCFFRWNWVKNWRRQFRALQVIFKLVLDLLLTRSWCHILVLYLMITASKKTALVKNLPRGQFHIRQIPAFKMPNSGV